LVWSMKLLQQTSSKSVFRIGSSRQTELEYFTVPHIYSPSFISCYQLIVSTVGCCLKAVFVVTPVAGVLSSSDTQEGCCYPFSRTQNHLNLFRLTAVTDIFHAIQEFRSYVIQIAKRFLYHFEAGQTPLRAGLVA
jgi:hypothetical protein